jgi:hypothetical protein
MLPEAGSADGIAPTEKLDPAGHPDSGLLERFVRGDLSGARGRAECRMIVRHLLAGCPVCTRITRRLWRLGDFPGEVGDAGDSDGAVGSDQSD